MMGQRKVLFEGMGSISSVYFVVFFLQCSKTKPSLQRRALQRAVTLQNK